MRTLPADIVREADYIRQQTVDVVRIESLERELARLRTLNALLEAQIAELHELPALDRREVSR